jgi:hypothetical protein
MREFLKKLGMRPRKVGQIPAKADVKEQEAFKEEKLEPRLSAPGSSVVLAFASNKVVMHTPRAAA